jgi:hypothetical protein
MTEVKIEEKSTIEDYLLAEHRESLFENTTQENCDPLGEIERKGTFVCP